MIVALYATIWTALALLAAAEAGRTRLAWPGGPAPWAWTAWNVGGVLAVVHPLIALDIRYGWDHELAAGDTARRSAEVYGYAWRGSIYVNYLFVLAWFGESWRWRRAEQRRRPVSPTVTWALRGFLLLIIVNAAIVFAVHTISRAAGVLVVAALVWCWTSVEGTNKAVIGGS